MFYSRLSDRSELNRADAAAIFGTALALRAADADLVEFGTGSNRVKWQPACVRGAFGRGLPDGATAGAGAGCGLAVEHLTQFRLVPIEFGCGPYFGAGRTLVRTGIDI